MAIFTRRNCRKDPVDAAAAQHVSHLQASTVHTFLSYLELREVSSCIVYVTYILYLLPVLHWLLAAGEFEIHKDLRLRDVVLFSPGALFSPFGRSLDGFEPQCCCDFVSPVAQAELAEEPPQDMQLSCNWSSYSSAWLPSNRSHVGEFVRLTGIWDHVTHVFQYWTLKSIGFL